jgi:nitroreductase
MLWAAQGATASDGKRAVPSAGALYPLGLYAVGGNVAHLPAACTTTIPFRMNWCSRHAPAVICIAAVFERTMVKYSNRGRGYVFMEAGHAAESLMLQAVVLGLAATMVGAFDDDDVHRLLHLAPDEIPLCLLAVGTP